MAKDDVRAAARAKAAEQREAARRRKRRNRALAIGGGALGVLVVAGAVTGIVIGSTAGSPAVAASGGAAAAAAGRTTTQPWSAPADVGARVKDAGLTLLSAEGTVLHIHQHLSVTVDGKAVQVPAELGIDEAAQGISAIHTHDTSGIIHVESPTRTTFRLGQFFTEWDVALGTGRIGGYRNGVAGAKVAFFVDGKPYTKDPADLALASHQDIDVVVTTDGSTPKAPTTEFTFPDGY